MIGTGTVLDVGRTVEQRRESVCRTVVVHIEDCSELIVETLEREREKEKHGINVHFIVFRQ